MELEDLWGLPAHPLVVHAAVVLLPLAAVATLVCAAVPSLRRQYAPIALGLAIAATAAVGLAQGSGESLQERVDRTPLVHEHTEQGERVLPWSIGVTVVAAAVTALPYVARRRPSISPRATTATALVLALVVGIGAMVTIVEVGHSGAKATWNGVSDEHAGPP